jgi:peptidyl-prolyl cis-trans isomerase D
MRDGVVVDDGDGTPQGGDAHGAAESAAQMPKILGLDDEPNIRELVSVYLTAAGFESQVRNDLAMQALPDAVQSSAFLPRAVRDRLAAIQDEAREVRQLRFASADFKAQVNPDEAQLKAYYDANPKAFETPESARIEYVVLSREALASQITMGEDDLKTYYEQNKSRFGTPEERRASHILLKAGPQAKEKAESLLAKIKADPTQFEALAKSNSDDPGSAAQGGDLGFFGQGMMVKPFSDAVFEMQKGEVKGPVESEFGLHIIRLTDIKAGGQKPFAAVRADIEKEVKLQQAGRKYAEAAENFTNMVYEQSDTLKPAAEKYGLTIQIADSVTRQPAAGAARGSALANARLLDAVFGDDVLRNKRNTEAIEIAPGQLAAARVIEYRAPTRKPIDEVRDALRQAVVDQESLKLARQAGEARLAALKSGKDDLAGFSLARTISRADPGGLSPLAMEAVFRMPAQSLPSVAGTELGNEGYLVTQLLKVITPPADLITRRAPAIEQQGVRILAQQDVASYIEAVKARAKVVRHPERIGQKDAPR